MASNHLTDHYSGAALPAPFSTRHRAASALAGAARFWFAVTVAGQLMFAAYAVLLYGGAALRGDMARWNTVMTHGHVAGDTAGNTAIGAHLLLAVVVMLGGALQLLPSLRDRVPRLHRWNGRLYVAGAAVASVSGMYMLWWRGSVGDLTQHLGTTLNGLLILLFAGLAVQRARTREFAAHRRWALRLFLAVSGVWFFRVGLMFWIAVHGGPSGFDATTFRGPFLSFLAFAQCLLPLTVLELYLRSRARGALAHYGMAALLAGLTVAMGVGVAVATVGMWLPQMHR